MEKLVETILKMSGHWADLQQLSAYLKNNEEVLIKWGPKLDEVLNYIDPQQASLGYTFLLYTFLPAPSAYYCIDIVKFRAQLLTPGTCRIFQFKFID